MIQEIENRFAYSYPEDEDDDSYEIEIVEDDGDADFYLEIVDGEVFYVFETEDDISEDDSEESDEMEDSETETDLEGSPRQPLQLPIATMSAPPLLDDDDSDLLQPVSGVSEKVVASTPTQMDFHASMSSLMSSENEAMLMLEDDHEEDHSGDATHLQQDRVEEEKKDVVADDHQSPSSPVEDSYSKDASSAPASPEASNGDPPFSTGYSFGRPAPYPSETTQGIGRPRRSLP